jgi:hypothetical protein
MTAASPITVASNTCMYVRMHVRTSEACTLAISGAAHLRFGGQGKQLVKCCVRSHVQTSPKLRLTAHVRAIWLASGRERMTRKDRGSQRRQRAKGCLLRADFGQLVRKRGALSCEVASVEEDVVVQQRREVARQQPQSAYVVPLLYAQP